MTVGTDSYVSLQEADEYVTAFYSAKDVWNEWASKTDDQKESLLIVACADLDSLPFVGMKKDRQQALAFPRAMSSEVPQSVKTAQIEIALLPLGSTSQEADGEAAQRASLQRQGVTSFSLGDLTESYGDVSAIVSDYPFMADPKISRLLKRYLSGGYIIC